MNDIFIIFAVKYPGMYAKRVLEKQFLKAIKPNKAVILLGARRTGKTIFIKQIAPLLKHPVMLLNGEDRITCEKFERRSVENFKTLLGDTKTLIIDEAQKIPDIGNVLKLIIDTIDGISVIATGSSAFDLSGMVGEPLTGRKTTFYLFPFSQKELSENENAIETTSHLEDRLIYGSYPELTTLRSEKEKVAYLNELVSSYLIKDILSYQGIKHSGKIYDLLRLIAFQVGSQVSLEELGRKLDLSKNTVFNYLDLLTKVFVLFNLKGFSRNLRDEVTRMHKWYFYDTGIRNVLIANINPLRLRNDAGALWENYLASERLKHQKYSGMLVNNYFWRTHRQQEIDWVEERGGNIYGYEFKWSDRKNKVPPQWKEGYPSAKYRVITQENYLKWIM